MKKLTNKEIYSNTLNELELKGNKDNGLCWAIRNTLLNYGYDLNKAENIGYMTEENKNYTLSEYNLFFEDEDTCDFPFGIEDVKWDIRELILMFCIEMCD